MSASQGWSLRIFQQREKNGVAEIFSRKLSVTKSCLPLVAESEVGSSAPQRRPERVFFLYFTVPQH